LEERTQASKQSKISARKKKLQTAEQATASGTFHRVRIPRQKVPRMELKKWKPIINLKAERQKYEWLMKEDEGSNK